MAFKIGVLFLIFLASSSSLVGVTAFGGLPGWRRMPWGIGSSGSSSSSSSSLQAKKKSSKKTTGKPTTSTASKGSALERCIALSSQQYDINGKDVIVVVDANNVRGKTDLHFEWTDGDLLRLLKDWRSAVMDGLSCTSDTDFKVELICVMDHGCQSQVVPIITDLGLLVFAGPRQTADDVIAAATRWLTTTTADSSSSSADGGDGGGNTTSNTTNTNNTTTIPNVFVITSDRELKQRCLRNNRPGNFKRNQKQKDHVKVFDSRSFVQSLQQHKNTIVPSRTENTSSNNSNSNQLELESMAIQFGTSVRDYQSSTQQSRLPTEQGFHERTWHRVLFAEYLRRLLTAKHASHSSPSSASSDEISQQLRDYQHRFEQHQKVAQAKHQAANDQSTANTTVPSTTSINSSSSNNSNPSSSMFLDHRIKCDPYQQQALLHYFDHQTSTSGGGGGGDASLQNDSTHTATIANSDTTLPSSFLEDHPAESCTAFLRNLIQESVAGKPSLTSSSLSSSSMLDEDLLLAQYIETAPSRLQFRQSTDVRRLIRIVLRIDAEAEGKDKHVRWYDSDSNRRRRENVVDEALVEMGGVLETRWLASL